jgi:hypothetical protein
VTASHTTKVIWDRLYEEITKLSIKIKQQRYERSTNEQKKKLFQSIDKYI